MSWVDLIWSLEDRYTDTVNVQVRRQLFLMTNKIPEVPVMPIFQSFYLNSIMHLFKMTTRQPGNWVYHSLMSVHFYYYCYC